MSNVVSHRSAEMNRYTKKQNEQRRANYNSILMSQLKKNCTPPLLLNIVITLVLIALNTRIESCNLELSRILAKVFIKTTFLEQLLLLIM